MKRKRKSHNVERAEKRVKLADAPNTRSTLPLLRQYYSHVLTLRHYLAARLATASKRSRRRLCHYGLLDTDGGKPAEPAVTRLLDTTYVGTFDATGVGTSGDIAADLSVFTQQVSESDITISPTQGAFKQTEIVDFVVWHLFRRHAGNRRPTHILCHGFQRTTNGAELEIVAGMPGIFSSCRNAHVQALREQPWAALPVILGSRAERILGDLLLDCGVFIPVGDSSNFNQLSGIPMSELKPLLAQHSRSDDAAMEQTVASVATPKRPNPRGLRDVRLMRHRMLYAKPSLTSKGQVRHGLTNDHIFNRLRDHESARETVHVMKYIFPRQFDLHNAFTSVTDPKDAGQLFKDYAQRDKEITHSEARAKRKRPDHGNPDLLVRPAHSPKRLRGQAFDLVRRMRKRHARCPYHALLLRYCPQQGVDFLDQSSFSYSSPPAEVSAFCRAIIAKVFPNEFWGCGDRGLANRKMVLQSVDRFVRLRRFESLTMHDILQPISITGVQWLATPNTDSNAKLSKPDFAKRRELMAEMLYYLFDSFLIPLIRGTFHVTESNVHRNQIFYFRQDVWKAMSEPALTSLKNSMFEECSAARVKEMLATRALGVSQVRLLPKEQGMRPIINLRRRVQKLQHGELVLGKSINSILTPAFSILNFEKGARPEMLGSALFSVDDLFPRLQAYRTALQQNGLGDAPLYFAKVDVQACFDTIPQKRLMALIKTVISAEDYKITRYARAKLLGGHNEETPGFGAKPSWKFLTKAAASEKPFDFAHDVAADTAEGRSRTVYIDGVNQRVERRKATLGLLEEHVRSNLIKIGKRYYRQKQGIPQGSIVSSLLCSYIYAELEREVLGFLKDGHSLLLRLIDDFLVITTQCDVAERFMRVMHAGIPDFGVRVKAEKSRANFAIEINGESITSLPQASDFPYCGNAINTVTLDLSKDHERRRLLQNTLVDSVTVEYSKLPGQTFYRKTLNALKLQMHAMLLSTSYNSVSTVLANLYHSFSEVALKSYYYIRSLSAAQKPRDRLLISKSTLARDSWERVAAAAAGSDPSARAASWWLYKSTRAVAVGADSSEPRKLTEFFYLGAVDDVIKLACVLMKRRKHTSKVVLPYECAVGNAQVRWKARLGGLQDNRIGALQTYASPAPPTPPPLSGSHVPRSTPSSSGGRLNMAVYSHGRERSLNCPRNGHIEGPWDLWLRIIDSGKEER